MPCVTDGERGPEGAPSRAAPPASDPERSSGPLICWTRVPTQHRTPPPSPMPGCGVRKVSRGKFQPRPPSCTWAEAGPHRGASTFLRRRTWKAEPAREPGTSWVFVTCRAGGRRGGEQRASRRPRAPGPGGGGAVPRGSRTEPLPACPRPLRLKKRPAPPSAPDPAPRAPSARLRDAVAPEAATCLNPSAPAPRPGRAGRGHCDAGSLGSLPLLARLPSHALPSRAGPGAESGAGGAGRRERREESWGSGSRRRPALLGPPQPGPALPGAPQPSRALPSPAGPLASCSPPSGRRGAAGRQQRPRWRPRSTARSTRRSWRRTWRCGSAARAAGAATAPPSATARAPWRDPRPAAAPSGPRRHWPRAPSLSSGRGREADPRTGGSSPWSPPRPRPLLRGPRGGAARGGESARGREAARCGAPRATPSATESPRSGAAPVLKPSPPYSVSSARPGPAPRLVPFPPPPGP